MTIRSEHAPVYVRAILCEAIAYGDQHTGWWEWFDTDAIEHYPWAGHGTKRWVELDAKGRARWFTSQLWNCDDVVPAQYLAPLNLAPGMTYARLVTLLRHDLESEQDPSAPSREHPPTALRAEEV